jgi:hypothetical protein
VASTGVIAYPILANIWTKFILICEPSGEPSNITKGLAATFITVIPVERVKMAKRTIPYESNILAGITHAHPNAHKKSATTKLTL